MVAWCRLTCTPLESHDDLALVWIKLRKSVQRRDSTRSVSVRGRSQANPNLGEYVVLKSKVRVLMLAAFAVMMMGAVAASSASAAPTWKVRGSTLAGSEGITATFLPLANGLVAILKSKLPGNKATIEISCKKALLVGGKITAPNAGSATKIAFKECKVDTKECKLLAAQEAEIATSELSAETTDLSGVEPLFLKISPKAVGGLFTTIKLVECAGEGEFKIFGTAACAAAAKATAEQTLHLCQFGPTVATLLTTLKFGTEPATIEGGGSVSLVNGGNWSSTL
jgi:hypothetical protein